MSKQQSQLDDLYRQVREAEHRRRVQRLLRTSLWWALCGVAIALVMLAHLGN